jgi:hypothetical protein
MQLTQPVPGMIFGVLKKMKIDIIYSYYNGIDLLEKYIDHWNNNFNNTKHKINFIIVDDHSIESYKVINVMKKKDIKCNLQVYYVEDDILWNEMGARNLGGTQAISDVVLFLDWDHVITEELIHEIFTWEFNEQSLYLFHRKQYKSHLPLWDNLLFNKWLQETKIIETPGPRGVPVRSAFCLTRKLWENVGGFDEDFAGNYGKYDRMFRTNLFNYGVKEIMINNTPLIVLKHGITHNVNRDPLSTKINVKLYKSKKHGFCKPDPLVRFNYIKQYENRI